MQRDGVPGVVVALVEGGDVTWTGAWGFADLASGRAMTTDALFRVESLSKPVTAWGALRLVELGQLDLDAPVSECIGDRPPLDDAPGLTARQLLSHSAGIGLGDFTARFAPDASMPELAEHLAHDLSFIAQPGHGFAYSDTGFNLLELAMEECAGGDFATFMRREILAPLGMEHADFDWPDRPMPTGYDLRGQPVPPYIYPARASGGLHATAADMTAFVAASVTGASQSVLSPGSVAAMHRPEVAVAGLFGFAAEGYGLGHFTETLSDGREALWHGGQGYGWMSHLHIVPETGDGIVILSNSQRAWPLMAAVLREWSAGLGVAPVGMSRVLWAEGLARLAILALVVAAAVALWAILRGGVRSSRVRIAVGAAGVILLGAPAWAAMQDYLFIFSILPGLWPWLAVAAATCGLACAIVALRPARRRD